jgi:hypothetical protein
MRIWLEVVGIPEGACESLRRTAYDSYRRFLCRNGSNVGATTLDLRSGTCPFTGKGYLSVQVHSPCPVELLALQQFSDAIYAAHPLADDAIVRANRTVRIEDSCPEEPSPSEAEDRALRQEEVSCWVCGRFDGEEYNDPGSGMNRVLEVHPDPSGRVPLCAVCRTLLGDRRPAG